MAKKKLDLKLPKFKIDKKVLKILLILVAVLASGALLYRIKGWFVAAVVNGQPITRWSLNRQLEAQYGQSVLENEIVKRLILQAGQKENISVGQMEIAERIKKLEEQFKAQGSDLDTLLASQGQTRQNLEEQIKIQLIVEKILGKDVEITDEAIKEYYETNKDFFPKDSKFDDLKEEIRQDVFQQKMAEKFQPWLAELKEKAKIYYWSEW